MKIAAIYSRKSKFTGKGESIDNQVQLCKQYGENLGINEFQVYEDEGFSGGTTNRPEFQRLIKDAKAKKFEVLICYRLDRISRNIADFSTLINELQELGIGFVSIREQFDTSTPMGRAMMYIASVFAQLERETIAERIRDNMLELAKSGRWLGGQTPLGFESEAIVYYDAEMKQRKMYKLYPVHQELDVVKTIFNMYLELKSISQVLKYLLSNHIKTKNDCDWSKKQIQQVLTNTTYVKATQDVFNYLTDQGMTVVGSPDGKHGILTYNKKQGKKNYRSTDEWIAAVAKHDGIIDGLMWLDVQKLLESNKEKAPRLGKTHKALLTNVLRCKKCESTMRVCYGDVSKTTGEKAFYYTCTMKNNSGGTRCDCKNVRGDLLEAEVIAELKRASSNTGTIIEQLKKHKKEVAPGIDTTSEIENILKRIKDNDTSIQNLVKQLAENQGSIAAKFIITEIENINKSNEELKSKLNQLQTTNETSANLELNIEILIASYKNFNRLIGECKDLEEKRILINSVVETIYWDSNTGDIEIIPPGAGKKK